MKIQTLILNIYPVADKLGLALKSECDFMLSKLDGVVPDVIKIVDTVVPEPESKPEVELVKVVQEINPAGELAIGTLIRRINETF